MSSQWVTKTQYHKLTESSDSMSDEEQPLQRDLHSTSNVSKRVMLLISTASFISGLCAAVLLSKLPSLRASTSYEAGFITDIDSLRPAIDTVEIKFSGTLKYKENEHLYIDIGSDGVKYFGNPSIDVDGAWSELIGDHEGAFGGDVLGPDVLHSLHCLNEVRKVLDSKYYYNRTLESLNRGRRIHIDHCLNHLRQIIQCHMDLTPVRTLYFPEMNTEVGDFDQVHTCRDFGRLRQYMNEHFLVEAHEPKVSPDGRIRRLGYPDNEEAVRVWDDRGKEFD